MKRRNAQEKVKAVGKPVTFLYENPSAKTVIVAGTFNEWHAERDPLKKDRTGKWKIVKYLSPGSHEYRFVVDNIWTTDPLCLMRRPNIYGGDNCVIEV